MEWLRASTYTAIQGASLRVSVWARRRGEGELYACPSETGK